MPSWLALGGAILLEVLGTTSLSLSQQFTKPLHVVTMTVCYGLSFFLLSIAFRTIPVGLAYAVWAGLGIVLIAIMGVLVLGQRLDLPAVIGASLIIAGVVVINLWSDVTPH